MKYSVVIPLYNKEQCVEQTVRSVLAQTVKDFEIVVVDDGSTDRGAEIIEALGSKKIRVIRQENQGVSVARNKGISEAQGEFVCFLDADDLWKDNFLSTVDRLIEEFPEASIFCPSYEVSYIRKVVVPEWRSTDPEKDSLVNDFFEMATGSFWVTHSSNTAVRKTALQEMDELFPAGETVYEDFDFWLRLGSKNIVAHSNDICGTYNRITAENARTTHTGKIVYSKSYMRTLNGFLHDPELTTQQKRWVREILDRRMVPYVFSLILCQKNEKAGKVLEKWHPTRQYSKYKWGLRAANVMPHGLIVKVQEFRYKRF